ncbi:MAG: hypothetical protein GXY44_07675 [Phycisphaerales bacterium]|nr:hypothetical protein [Phycisphaerales bacterium]
MKQSRRQELKTNELGEYLSQIYDWAVRNSNYLLGGAVAIVLVLGISWVVHSNRIQAIQSAWIEYNELEGIGSVTPAHIERADTLVAKFSQTQDLGPRVTFLKSDLAYKRAMSLSGEDEQEQRIKLLQDAKDTLLSAVNVYAKNRQAVAQSYMRLAAIEETLVLAGVGDREQVRSFYNKAIDEATAPYAEDATSQLETLDERLAILPLVASRPAEDTGNSAAAALPEPAIQESAPADDNSTKEQG